MGKKIMKNYNSKKPSSSPKDQAPSKKSLRKCENPIRIPPIDQSLDFGQSDAWICKNSACKATLSMDDTFCKRCSCCICHLFDDNKDPSLWLECTSESGNEDCCGLSCHIECALRFEKVGVVNLGQLMQLDGSYCCFACGKVSAILGCWKKQLTKAIATRRVDDLCERILLSFRLLDGTLRFKELHKIVEDTKTKLENEVGPLNGVSSKMAGSIVSSLSVASEVQKLCCLAIEKADEWLATVSSSNLIHREESLLAACKFYFEEVTCSSVVIVLIELPSSSTEDIKGYKLWYCKIRDESHSKEPISVFPRSQRRILISNLQPCTEYSFKLMSYTEKGDLGHSEANCFTGSRSASKSVNPQTEDKNKKDLVSSSDFKVRDLGKTVQFPWAQEQGCLEGLSGIDLEEGFKCDNVIKPGETLKDPSPNVSREIDLNISSVPDLEGLSGINLEEGFECDDVIKPVETLKDPSPNVSRDFDLNIASVPDLEGLSGIDLEDGFECDDVIKPVETLKDPSPNVSRELDLNIASLPDLNEELTPPFGFSRDENNEAVSRDVNNNGLARSLGSDGSRNWVQQTNGEVPALNSIGRTCGKRSASMIGDTHDCNSILGNESPFNISNGLGCLDDNFEYCVKTIRWLECEGHIKQEIRLKLLTWFSLRSNEQQRRVVHTFIQSMIDDPVSLAAQLVDLFDAIMSNKRPKTGFWH